ncbi:hypothetical protein HQ43_01560 [Porphyromonas canoris]|uniref:Uncharacterized protein n=1 Tax=Porphyromonas canoris TaxID=36875 RepID=A0ABR4XML7_9PORP|nr:hypothetical protein HQ43_01560 [Porphyromonas canoris]
MIIAHPEGTEYKTSQTKAGSAGTISAGTAFFVLPKREPESGTKKNSVRTKKKILCARKKIYVRTKKNLRAHEKKFLCA